MPAWSPPPPDERVPVSAAEGGVPLALDFTSVGRLHRGYFSDPELTAALSAGLAACTALPVRVVITYDGERRLGRVVGVVAAEALGCKAQVSADGVALGPLLPLTQALASYRNAVGAAKDMRVYGFRLGLRVEDGVGGVNLWAEGQDPVDGSAVAPCVGVDGLDWCAPGEARDGVTVLRLGDARAAARVGELLGPR